MPGDLKHHLLVEGWRSIPHSYAMVNQFQLLEMMRRTAHLVVAHRDLPYFQPSWRPSRGLFPAEMEEVLDNIPPPAAGDKFDAVYRIGFPFDLQKAEIEGRTVVFGTAEFGSVPDSWLMGGISLTQAHHTKSIGEETIVVTPSQWSRKGFLFSGAEPKRVVVVPHGVDPAIFHPVDPEKRAELRRKLGWDGFVFLHVGAMTANKGVQMLLKAFATAAPDFPQIRLVLKGMDALYLSNANLARWSQGLSRAESQIVQGRVHYEGRTLSVVDVAELYQAADAYVTPYAAEGFNLPALEAASCGLPLICTSGGPTDDFTREDFALRIDAKDISAPSPDGGQVLLRKPDFDHLLNLMRRIINDPAYCQRAREAGPAFVNAGFTWRHVVDRLWRVLFV